MLRSFESLVGETHHFFGVIRECLNIDGDIWLPIVETDEYGRRFGMEGVVLAPVQDASLFYRKAIARVTVIPIYDGKGIRDSSFAGYQIVDVDDGHMWVEFGTNQEDPYDHKFCFSYMPKDVIVSLPEISKFQHFNGETVK